MQVELSGLGIGEVLLLSACEGLAKGGGVVEAFAQLVDHHLKTNCIINLN